MMLIQSTFTTSAYITLVWEKKSVHDVKAPSKMTKTLTFCSIREKELWSVSQSALYLEPHLEDIS